MGPLAGVRAILFDLDGVLVDSRRPIAGSIRHALRACGAAVPPAAELFPLIGDPLQAIFRGLLGERGGDRDAVLACVAAYREHYARAALEESRLVDGVAEVLRGLCGERPLAVATSKPAAFAEPILETLGVRDCFHAVVGPGLDAELADPKAWAVERALEALEVTPSPGEAQFRAALVGDRHHDVRAARRTGIAAVGVRWGIGSEQELRSAGAAWLLERPAELGALFARGPAHEPTARGAGPA